MPNREQDRVHRVMSDEAQGNQAGQKLRWDPQTKTIRAVNYDDPDRTSLEITPSDMEHFIECREV